MGRLIEEQAVIDCLTNTAKYYEREDADEWTKGIHYGLLHGLDNILDNAPAVEAIQKVNVVTMLEDIQLEIKILANAEIDESFKEGEEFCVEIIQKKINALNAESEKDNGNDV